MNIFCFSISHQTANVELRERFAVADSALPTSLARLSEMRDIAEGVVLSTCNRTEFYLVSENAQLGMESFIRDFYGSMPVPDLAPLIRFSSNQTVRHLFRVAAGLESMVLGETEIFGQVKRAYEAAVRSGATGKILNKLFQKAFYVGKQVRSTTGVTRGSVSVGSVAVDLAQQIFGKLRGCKIMILGAGDTSEKTARCFQARGAEQLFVSNRSFDRAAALAASMGARAIRFDDWESEFHDLDILVSSTAAPHAIVTAAKLEPILRMRRDRPLFLIDLAIPRDVEPEVHNLEGAYVYDLDALQLIAQQALEERRKEAEASTSLIEKHVREFQSRLRGNGDSPIPSAVMEFPRL
jgi:glutamyl-tRNA reductase